VAVRFWINCICSVKNYCIVGSIANSCGGGNLIQLIGDVSTNGISCPAPDLVFTI
jgi:hypothetical protein